MDLSIIIVTYNVKYFLEQCLCSLNKAIEPLKAEIILIDNSSSDETIEFVQCYFPGIKIVPNSENIGFAKANNRAIAHASGRNILFLNPDTIISEDSLFNCVSFMDQLPLAGAIGIRMIDGGGQFLKESKRGFPTLWASFCKLSGLTRVFPSSSIFARYYMGHLPENQNQEVDSLSGAFMMVKKQVLDITGGFDEMFFMYAEDIDLSFRIKKAGFQNYYFSTSAILHFKGESTTKDNRYIKLFYKAMIQFVEKHYSPLQAFPIKILLNVIINIRSLFNRITPSKTKFRLTNFEPENKFQSIGDKNSIGEISRAVSLQQEAENIVFCPGKQYSYKEMIEEMQHQHKNKRFYIHGYNTQSIIGSNSKEEQGASWQITSIQYPSNNQLD
ncbi:MAG: glycosyltransferase family 2 protein [Chitinophagaceae bacterium]